MSFRGPHYADEPLLLPNAGDVSSALAFHDAGYRAIGTTGIGVAAIPGGRVRSLSDAWSTSLGIWRLHVSADIEDGYDDDPDVVAD